MPRLLCVCVPVICIKVYIMPFLNKQRSLEKWPIPGLRKKNIQDKTGISYYQKTTTKKAIKDHLNAS